MQSELRAPLPLATMQKFDDFDDFANAIQHVNCRLTIKKWHESRFAVNYLDVGGLKIQQAWNACECCCEGSSEPNGRLLFFPIATPTAPSVNGIPLDAQAVVILEPGSEFCVATASISQWFSLFVPTDLLNGNGKAPRSSVSGSSSACRVLQMEKSQKQHLYDLLQRVSAAQQSSPDIFTDPVSATRATSQLLAACPTEIGGRHSTTPVSRPVQFSRQELVRRALQWLESRNGQSVSIGEWSTALNISERTLRYVFDDYYGVSPTRFLKLRQLHQVQRALKKARPNETVTTILRKFGIWELGRFAQNYRKLFGELPSQTLKRALR